MNRKSNFKIYTVIVTVLIVLIITVLLYEKYNKPDETLQKTSMAMDTIIGVTVYGAKPEDEAALDGAMKLCSQYDKLLSISDPDSEIYKMNHRDSDESSVQTTHEVAELISTALRYCELSGGAFDITIEPVKELWDFDSDSEEHKLPNQDEIQTALSAVDYTKVRVDTDTDTIYFDSAQTRIDLGAIGKGYIADRVKEYLKANGVDSAIINLGGNVLCVGEYPDGTAFKIGLQRPYADHTDTVETLKIDDMSVVSSGVYERHFVIDGVNYHHILNPHTGYPYQNGLTQVSIITTNSTDADALSTVVFCMGEDAGSRLIETMPSTYAFFMHEDGSITYTSGAEILIDN